MGRSDGRRARPGRGHPVRSSETQCHRNPFRLLRGLPRASGRRESARSGAQAGFHGYVAVAPHRAAPAVVRTRPHRLDRPIWRHRARIVLGLLRPGIRHPPEHRDHESTSSDARDQRGDGGREARGRRHDFERRGQLRGHQSRHRALLVPPRSREALRHGGRRAPPDSLRANGRYVPGARHARRPRGLSAADWRGDRLHLWRGREALGRNESG